MGMRIDTKETQHEKVVCKSSFIAATDWGFPAHRGQADCRRTGAYGMDRADRHEVPQRKMSYSQRRETRNSFGRSKAAWIRTLQSL